ncbi:2'-5' RNA ligase family protein [Hymenobacter endophyticus]|uniref:2'-5' RNA ligase family protein n=1 Tax=Hymenobacter endophyticus TaxID=3076335 RepID=A0ABU3TJQ8_9BACT|nr:2'-5' RNA ligase family protein [Hymenobacter endophyticus]MDU0371611.1 2'-5' RNA ligase family protein [Hymenobacter endophyticus]
MLAPVSAPLIITLTLNAEAHAYYTGLRQQHFPPERNYLQAHVTLFHHLPGEQVAAVQQQLLGVAARTAPLLLQVTGVRFLGRGVAYTLENTALQQLHRQLQTAWSEWLLPQDRQPLRPHITVQNKVDPAQARALHEQLATDFAPSTVTGLGFTVWAYEGGPWRELFQVPFAGPVPA